MNQREQLMKTIETEREKLNALLESGAQVENAYEQSQVVDQLLEEYMECQ